MSSSRLSEADRARRAAPGRRARHRGMPAVQPAGLLARAGGAREASGVPRRNLLGTAGARLGNPEAEIVLVGLAPGAHGANRTGRVFTGDRSGDFLYSALHRQGLASQPTATSRDDGLSLRRRVRDLPGALRAARQQAEPRRNRGVLGFLQSRARGAPASARALGPGKHRMERLPAPFAAEGAGVPRSRPAFGHGAEVRFGPYTLLGSYHVSQQNTQTGRLTPAMFDRGDRARPCAGRRSRAAECLELA